jgi:hypothetical protein
VPERLGDHRLADADSDGERLQQLRDLLPCDVNVISKTHPLYGERLAAISFRHKGNELLLVAVLPDGTPGTIAAVATDVFGELVAPDWAATPLSVEGVRRFRALVEAHLGKVGARRRPRPWKVVRHKHGVEPLRGVVHVCSAHTTEPAARRARDRQKAAMIRGSGYEAAARWAWSVVSDPAGLFGATAAGGGRRSEGDL